MSGRDAPFAVRLTGADRGRFWFWDPSHFPGPVSPAAQTLDLPAMAAGFAAAGRELRRPMPGQFVRVERGFVYFGIDIPETAAALAEREATYKQTVTPLLTTALDRWTDEYAPEARRLTEALLALAERSVSDRAFASALDEAIDLRGRQWRVHDLALVPAMEAAARFTARYAALLGGAAAAQVLLQGFPNRQTQAAEALDELAEMLRGRPMPAALLTPMQQIPPEPASEAGDRRFEIALGGFLERHGQRAEGWDVGMPTWAEDPSPVFTLLRERLRRPAAEPGARRRRAAEQRDAAVAAALGRLAEGEQPAFLRSLRAAQAYTVVSEDHHALIDQQGLAALRSVLLAAGRGLVANGSLRHPTDAAWLTRAELAETLVSPRNRRRLLSARRAARRRQATLTPPRTLGRPLPAWAVDNPTLAGFFGLGAEPARQANQLQGVGVSGGVADGRACVVQRLDQLDALQEGDILVCPTTSPAWTPWLGLIAGAVVESGGMLSHTAILAREYGIPCVVNVRDATSHIGHGSQITVDGDAGVVRLLH